MQAARDPSNLMRPNTAQRRCAVQNLLPELRKEGVKDGQELLRRWREKLLDPQVPTQRVNGLWHVGIYQGLITDVVEGTFHEAAAAQHTDVRSEEGLSGAYGDAPGRQVRLVDGPL